MTKSRINNRARTRKTATLQQCEVLEIRQLMTANPVVGLQSLVQQPLIGDTFQVGLTFSNTGNSTGYGPYVDVIVPRGQAADHGIQYVGGSARFLDRGLSEWVIQFDANGNANHPFAVDCNGNPVSLKANAGDQLVVLQMPFGSFVPNQPSLQINLQFAVGKNATPSVPLTLSATGGFRYGSDALDNPKTDAPLRGTSSTLVVTPCNVQTRLTYLGPENETATGANFVQSYRVDVDVAAGTNIDQLTLDNVFDRNQVYQGIRSLSWDPKSVNVVAAPPKGVVSDNSHLTLQLGSFTGKPGTDGSYILDFFVPQTDSNNKLITDPILGTDGKSVFSVQASGSLIVTPATATTDPVINKFVTSATHTLEDQNVTVQQSYRIVTDANASGLGPGDVLEYRINFQVSDYAWVKDLLLKMTIPNGQRLVSDSPVAFSVSGIKGYQDGSVTNSAKGLTLLTQGKTTGQLDYQMNLSTELQALGLDGILRGGATTGSVGRAVTGSLTYRTIVLDSFEDGVASKDLSIDEGDRFQTQVLATASTVTPATQKVTTYHASDDSGLSQQLAVGGLSTNVYAINGQPASDGAPVKAGDLVTYRITRDVRSSDIENLSITEFLPMPIYQLGSLVWQGNETTVKSGTVRLGGGDSFHSLFSVTPVITVDKATNSFKLSYPSVDSTANKTTTIELLVTVAVQDQPFADGMWLTSVAHVDQGSSNNGTFSQNAITSVQYTRPVLSMLKAAISSDNPAALLSGPVNNTNISRIDAGDTVRFQIYVENTGLSTGGAYNTLIKDAIPTGFVIPTAGLGMTVTDSSGKSLRYSRVNSNDPNSLLSTGIQLIDVLSGCQATDGSNRLVVQYNLQAVESVRSGITSSSNAQLVVYTALPNGNNYVISTTIDGATETTATPIIEHTLVSTDQAGTTSNQVVIGETATYRVKVTIPEVTMSNASLQIDLPRGMAIQRILGVAVDSELGLTTTDAASILASAKILNVSSADTDAGRILRLQIGDVINRNRDNSRPETIEITYAATITNDVTVLSGSSLRSNAVWTYDGKSASLLANELKVVEPKLKVTASWSAANVDANDTVTVTLDVAHDSASGANAYDVRFSDSIPGGAAYVPGSLRWVSGAAPQEISDGAGSGSFVASWGSIDKGSVSRLQYKVIVNRDVQAGLSLVNTAKIDWTSIPGLPGRIATSSPLAVERTGDITDVGGAANKYLATYVSNIAVSPVKVSITLLSSNVAETTGSNLTIGERATYQVVLTIPEGVTSLNLAALQKDTDSVMVPESLKLISIGQSLSAPSLTVGKTLLPANGQLKWDLGTVTNLPDNRETTADTIVFQLTTFIPNVAANTAGDRPVMSAVTAYPLGTASATSTVTIVEPALQISQKVSQSGIDAGDVIDATLQISHFGGTSRTAFSLDLGSIVSPGLTLVPGSIATNLGTIVAGNGVSDKMLEVMLGQLSDSQTLQIRYQVRVNNDVAVGASLSLPANVSWKSMASDEGRSYSSKVSTPLTVNSNTIGGWVFVDANQDGTQQGTDRSLYQVQVKLQGVDHLGNLVQRSASTDASGRYQFTNLRPGNYSVIEAQPGKWTDGKDWAGTAGGVVSNDRIDIGLPRGSNLTADGYNFTESPLTWISGTVYVDADQNGKLAQDEDGIKSIPMTLAGTTDLGLAVTRTTLTNDRGYYVFDYLEPGTYSVSEGATPGYLQASNQVGTRGGALRTDAFDKISVKSALPGEMYNFGEYRPGSISGQVYIDYDRDGVMDRKDGLIANVEVNLAGTNDLGQSVSAVLRTNETGRYTFDNLRPGNYAISTKAVTDLNFEVSNVGRVLGAYGPASDNGTARTLGFAGIRLRAGIVDVGYNVGHTDPAYKSTIVATAFDSQVSIAGTNADDVFSVQVNSSDATILVGGQTYHFDSSSTRSIRLLGSFGNDTFKVVATEDKEEFNLRKSSATVTGTWFEIRSYGMEEVTCIGGGNEDVARFYDSDTDDTFTAAPFTATMQGTGYKNRVEGIHRIYAYATNGRDSANLTGAAGQRDNFSVQPGDARLYGDKFYLYASGFDDVTGNATDELDRAYLYGSTGNDLLTGAQAVTTLKSGTSNFIANKYLYTRAQLDQGGTDRAVLVGSDGNDSFWSRPTESTWNVGSSQIIVQDAEQLEVNAGLGLDTATVYDTHYDDTFTVNPTKATMVNQVSSVTMTGFEKVNSYANAGGVDRAFVSGTTGADVFRASPSDWSLQGGNVSFFGSGFTSVNATGDSSDVAYLTDSSFNDSLLLSSGSATMIGQQYSNSAAGFGVVKATSIGGDDNVTFIDDDKSSTIKVADGAATIFGAGFDYELARFSHYEAFFQKLTSTDSVSLAGQVQYVLSSVTSDQGKFKLSIGTSPTTPLVNLTSSIDKLNLTV